LLLQRISQVSADRAGMVLLDPRQGYTIRGLADDDQETSAEQDIHPKVLHLKLSASILEAIVISQDGPNAARLTSPSGSDPVCVDAH
jgi:hypothetical protein